MRSNTHWVLTPTKALFRRQQILPTSGSVSLQSQPRHNACWSAIQKTESQQRLSLEPKFSLLFLPLLTVRGDAKLGFKFKISLKINVRLPFDLKTSRERFMETGAKPKSTIRGVKLGVSLRSWKWSRAWLRARRFYSPAWRSPKTWDWAIFGTNGALKGLCKAIEGSMMCMRGLHGWLYWLNAKLAQVEPMFDCAHAVFTLFASLQGKY